MRRALIIALALSFVAAAPDKTTFPVEPCIALSPDGRHAVVCKPSNDAQHYDLFMTDLDRDTEVYLERWARGVDVLWAPDSESAAVTYWPTSTDAAVTVYSASGRLVLDPQGVLERKYGRPYPKWADHVYFEAFTWLRNDALVVKLWGYGGARNFAQCYTLTLRGVVSRLARCPKLS
jgi:hypothetical protein